MAIVNGYAQAWACPANDIDCAGDGLRNSYDDGGVSDPNPRDDCATAASA